jgi:hypothetical protein
MAMLSTLLTQLLTCQRALVWLLRLFLNSTPTLNAKTKSKSKKKEEAEPNECHMSNKMSFQNYIPSRFAKTLFRFAWPGAVLRSTIKHPRNEVLDG